MRYPLDSDLSSGYPLLSNRGQVTLKLQLSVFQFVAFFSSYKLSAYYYQTRNIYFTIALSAPLVDLSINFVRVALQVAKNVFGVSYL